MKVTAETPFWLAIALSSLLHAAVWLGDARDGATPTAVRLDDRWSANSVEVGTEPAPAGPSPAPAPAAPAPASTPNPTLNEGAKPAPLPTRPLVTAEATARRAQRREQSTGTDAAQAPASTHRAAAAQAPPLGEPAQGPEGSMGALELPPGVRHLAPAFTRALPASGYADPRWSELPPGSLGRTELEIVVDESGRISGVSFDPEKPPAPVVEQLVENTVMLLKAGTFSLDALHVSAGRERLALEVTLSDEPSPAPDAAPRGLFRKGFEPPSPKRPGYARFTLNSGRRMEALVRILSDR